MKQVSARLAFKNFKMHKISKKTPRQIDCTVEAKANVIQQLLCTSGVIHKLCRLKIGDF